MKSITQIYNQLFKKYGSQKWWPTTPINETTPKYLNSNRNLTENEILEICIGAILTQNTSWKNVERAIININIELQKKKEKSLFDLINKINEENLKELIKPAGFFNQKSKYLKNFIKYIIENYDSKINKLFDKEINDLKTELLSIKGIGKETGDSIILYSANKPIFVIDMYTKRMFSRIGYLKQKESYDNWQKLFHTEFNNQEYKNKPIKKTKLFNEFHALIVEHNKKYCLNKPKCHDCFLKEECNYYKNYNEN